MIQVAPLFTPYRLSASELEELDQLGHCVLPGILTEAAERQLVESLESIARLNDAHPERVGHPYPGRYAAEYDERLAALIGHPELLHVARTVLGKDIRYDHCVALNRRAGNAGMRWHSHGYSDDDPRLGFLRIFFYVNGFAPDDGGLKVVPGSHLFRDPDVHAQTDADLAPWLEGKRHPRTGQPLRIERLQAPPRSVVLMWTHALHGVTARKPDSGTRWTVVYAYRNPGQPSRARWITPAFEKLALPGTEGLMSLY